MFLLLIAAVILLSEICGANAESCYSGGGVAGIVIATVISTLVACAIAFLAYWFVWRPRRKGTYGMACNKLEVIEDGPDKFAYDNPYFQEDDDGGHQNGIKRPPDSSEIIVDKERNGSQKNIDQTEPLKNGKPSPLSNLIFTSNTGGSKPRSLDNAFISLEPDIISVPLRGHDFTGLGFNITGNMRDGIFVKDVLNRGPANDSGQVKSGDRILSVTVSFTSMVYEDALTILSYASPYDVSLELKKAGRCNLAGHEKKASMSSNDVMACGVNKGLSSDRLYHPLYRSQSIDDLTQIGKEQATGSMAINGGIPPKRSLSIGAPICRMTRDEIRDHSTKKDEGLKLDVVKKNDGLSKLSRSSSGSSSASSTSHDKVVEVMAKGDEVVIPIGKEEDKIQTKSPEVVDDVEEEGHPVEKTIITVDGGNDDNAKVFDSASHMRIIAADDDAKSSTPIDVVAVEDETQDKNKNERRSKRKGKAPPPPPSNETDNVTIVDTTKEIKRERTSSTSSSSSSDEEKEGFNDTKDGTASVQDDHSLVTAHDGSFEMDSLEKSEYHPSKSLLSKNSSVSDDSLEHEEVQRKSSSLGDMPKTDDVESGSDSLEITASLDLQNDQIPIEGQLGEQNKQLKRKAPPPPERSSTSSDDTLPSEQILTEVDTPEEVLDKDSLDKVPIKDDSKEPDSLEPVTDTEPKEEPVVVSVMPSTHIIAPTTTDGDPPTVAAPRRKDSSSSSDDEGKVDGRKVNEENTLRVIIAPDESDSKAHNNVGDDGTPEKVSERQVIKLELEETSSSSDDESKEKSNSEIGEENRDVEEPMIKSSLEKKIPDIVFPEKRSSDTSSSSSSSSDEEEKPTEKKKKVIVADFKLKADSSSSESEPSTPVRPENNGIQTSGHQQVYFNNEGLVSSTPIQEEMKRVQRPIVESQITPMKHEPNISSIDIPIIPPIITTNRSTANEKHPKAEVIEISRQELDDVMMTRHEFIMKQSDKRGSSNRSDSSFESWRYMTGDDSIDGSVVINGNTTYTSTYETNISIDGSSQPIIDQQKMSDESSTVLPSNGPISNTVVITNKSPTKNKGDIVDVRTSTTDDTSVPELKPPE